MCGNCDQHEHVVQPLMGSLKVQFHVGVGLNVAVLVCRQIVERRTDIVLKALDRLAYAGEGRGVTVAEYGGLRRKVRRRETGCKRPGYRRETMFHQDSPLEPPLSRRFRGEAMRSGRRPKSAKPYPPAR
jgi:hypothetical protein